MSEVGPMTGSDCQNGGGAGGTTLRGWFMASSQAGHSDA